MFGQNSYYQTYPNMSQNVVRVNGENGARMYNIGASSSALLLDENNPIVWLVQTDGAGYKTVTPYKIEPYVQEPEPNIGDLMKRIEHLEEAINESNLTKNERTEKPEQH